MQSCNRASLIAGSAAVFSVAGTFLDDQCGTRAWSILYKAPVECKVNWKSPPLWSMGTACHPKTEGDVHLTRYYYSTTTQPLVCLLVRRQSQQQQQRCGSLYSAYELPYPTTRQRWRTDSVLSLPLPPRIAL
ncbi:hypothetical protein EDD17DRAFT_509645 [Pisolithus thermaeus]|nr:hypothetical protein EDD17DRAFT_509645 [Pisolithus thermaeus]